MNEASPALSKVCPSCGARYPQDALFCAGDGTPLSSGSQGPDEEDPYIGQELSGHIQIKQLVGIGAMGRVYRAFQKGIDRDVAVKILHRELSANAQLVTRFTREAKVASRLQHPNVVQVLLAGQLPDRALYMVMEYLDGLSLQSALAAAGGSLPLSRALHIVMQLCEASGEAHAQGIVHRDLKPENVMLVKRGADPDFVKVLDFGIARINWGEQSVATAAGLIFGTARYISPEGAQGNTVGPPSDVYSIAVLLYQMLSGRTPFEGDQAVGLLVQQIHDAPPHLKSIARAHYVPDPLAEVIMANLAKDPKRREPEARSFGHAIVDAAKAAGLSPDEISRPMLRRNKEGAMQLPPTERTKAHDLTPEVIARMSPTPGPNLALTTKWEPPQEFQARLSEISQQSNERSSGIVPSSHPALNVAAANGTGSRPRLVDETMDDAMAPQPVAFPSAPPGSHPRTMPGTHYDTPEPLPAAGRPPSERDLPTEPRRALSTRPPSSTVIDDAPTPRRGIWFVVLCFVLGAGLAAGIAYKMGKFGPAEATEEQYVARATDAMFKNRFGDPPNDNVRDITDDGLRKFPGSRRLTDVRVRAASELVTKALAVRGSGDIAEALKHAKLARDLDPTDASAKRLVDQYEAELAAFNGPASTNPLPLEKPPVPNQGQGRAPIPSPTAFKAVLEVSVAQPRLGQTVELVARVQPSKGTFEAPAFTVTGPGTQARLTAQGGDNGVWKGSYVFLEAGKFDIVFSTQADGKPLRASRTVVAGDAPSPQPKPPELPATNTPPTPSATGSVKWM